MEPDIAKAVFWLAKAADAGQPTAMHTLGGLYFNGNGVERDVETGFRWLLRALRTYPPTDEKLESLRTFIDLAAAMLPAGRRKQIEAEWADPKA